MSAADETGRLDIDTLTTGASAAQQRFLQELPDLLRSTLGGARGGGGGEGRQVGEDRGGGRWGGLPQYDAGARRASRTGAMALGVGWWHATGARSRHQARD